MDLVRVGLMRNGKYWNTYTIRNECYCSIDCVVYYFYTYTVCTQVNLVLFESNIIYVV